MAHGRSRRVTGDLLLSGDSDGTGIAQRSTEKSGISGIFPEKTERRKEQAPGTDLYSQEACEYRVRNVKEPYRVPGAGEGNRERNCLKETAGGFIMEKRTAERENPLLFFCF